MSFSILTLLTSCLLGLALRTAAQAAPFTPGNFVVAAVGDGSASLTSGATPVVLLEYTPAGVLVQTVALPTSPSGANYRLTASGSATSELNLTRSGDGRYLVLAGYEASVGTASVASSAVVTTRQVVGCIAADGTVDTSSLVSDAFDGNNIRAAYSVDGSAFYAVGGTSGVRYLPLGNSGPTTSLAAALANCRYVGAFGGNLYVSSSTNATLGLSQVGTGLPTTAGQSTMSLPGLATAAGSSPMAFFLTDLSPSVPGLDVAYVVDDRTTAAGGIQKYSLVGGTWTLNGTITGTGATAPALRGIAGTVVNLTVTLAATAATGLYVVRDAAGYNVAPTSFTLPAAVATAASNVALRGVALAPIAGSQPLASRAPVAAAAWSYCPVPARGSLTIHLAGSTAGPPRAELYDLAGRPVLSAPLPASGELPVSELPAGVYLLRVAGVSGRVVIE